MVPDTHSGYSLCLSDVTFQISGLYIVRKVIKDTLSAISRVRSLEDRWFLIHFLDVIDVLEIICFKFQVCWMSGR